MSLEDCIKSICIIMIIFATTFYCLILWILSILIDIRKELRGKNK